MKKKDNVIVVCKFGLEGRFKIETRKVGSSERTLRAPWQDNLILNRGLDQLGTVNKNTLSSWMYTLAVGTSSTPPAVTDTGLGNKVAQIDYSATNDQVGQTTTAPYYGWLRRQYEFPVGTAAGNLSELGIKFYDNDNLLHTRALIKDSGGNPTTITVLPDEILIVTYEVRVYVDTTDKTFNPTIKGTATTVTIRPAQLVGSWFRHQGAVAFTDYVWGGYWYWGGTGTGVGPITGIPLGTQESFSNLQKIDEAYVPGSYRKVQAMRLNLQNMAGKSITGFMGLSAAVPYQVGFSPGVPKTADETVSLRLAVTWSRRS